VPRRTPAERSLERALLFGLIIHAVAMLSMVALLLPLLPGGPTLTPYARAAALAAAPWRATLGWVPWQLCALGDLWLAVALVRVPWIPRAAAWFSLAFTVAAVVPDQWGELQWTVALPALARGAMRSGDASLFAAQELRAYRATAAWGALSYTVAALGWTAAFAGAKTWSRGLSHLSAALWSTLLVVSLSPLMPASMQLPATAVAAGNALGFTLMLAWLYGVTERVLLRARPFTVTGRGALWRHPDRGPFGRACEFVANSRVFGAVVEPAPVPVMVSDITDVVYVNYVVEAARVLHLVPEGLELQRLGPDGRFALFTWLTFRHGHFGFAFMGPLRKLLPSPVQTNWRIHVRDPRTGREGIHFVTNAVDRTPPAMGARLTTEAMPMHVLRAASLARDEGGAVTLALDPGEGSAPDATCSLRPATAPALEGPWAACWKDFDAFLRYCVPQDRALSTQPWLDRVTSHEIHLGIDPARCEPLAGTVSSRRATELVGDARPLCFRVPSVTFVFASELHDPLPREASR
jgi:hypothetical protein